MILVQKGKIQVSESTKDALVAQGKGHWCIPRENKIVVAESQRFPELGREFYETGPARVRALLRDFLQKGVEEGKRLGFEQGRIDGVREGRIVGRREEEVRFRDDAAAALDALLDSAAQFRDAKERLLREAQDGVVALA